jgi:hypothetical protein
VTYHRGEYALPPVDPLDAAIVQLGLLYESEIPDEEIVRPTFIRNVVHETGDEGLKRKRPASGGVWRGVMPENRRAGGKGPVSPSSTITI